MNPTTEHHTEPATVRLEATAGAGMLARITAVLNPHPVIGFTFSESPDGVIHVLVRLGRPERGSAGWHVQRIVARLERIVGVTAIGVADERPQTPADSAAGVLVHR